MNEMTITEESRVCATPIQELLRGVPPTQRLLIDFPGIHPDFPSSCSIPVGSHCHDAAGLIDKLQEQIRHLEASQAGGWMPIESAPKDGYRILVSNPEWEDTEGVSVYWADDLWRINDNDFDFMPDATHWMPIPKLAPPNHQPEAQGEMEQPGDKADTR